MRRAFALALFVAVFVVPAHAGDRGGKKVAKQLRSCAPETYEAALDCLDRFLPPTQQATLAAPDGAIDAHFSLGMFIRNNWGLWREGPLFRTMYAMGFRHPDDMSGAILEGFAAHERGESYQPTPPDMAAQQAQWDQAVSEGRAGSFQCPKPLREAKTRKELKAEIEACLDLMAKSLTSDPE
jgi:hypothetical protein